MYTKYKVAAIWGLVCFLLLYRTLLAEMILSWQVIQHYEIPGWQLFVSYATNIVPDLLPLGCFILLTRNANFSKINSIVLPLIAWLIGRFVVVSVMWIITFKISNPPPFSGGLQNMVSEYLVNLFWSINTLTSALIILVCGYAFWRERRTS